MFRFLAIFLLLLVSIITLILVYKYDGVIFIDWLDYNLEISLTFALLILSFCFLVISFLSSLLTNLKNLVTKFRTSLTKYQKKKAYHNIIGCYKAIYHGNNKKIIQYKKRIYEFCQKHPSDELYEMAIVCYAQTANNIVDGEKERNFFISLLNDERFKKIALKYIIEKNLSDKKYNEALIYIKQYDSLCSNEGWFNKVSLEVFEQLNMYDDAKHILKILRSDETSDGNYLKERYQRIYLQHSNELFLNGEFEKITKELEVLHKYNYLDIQNIKMFVRSFLLQNQYNKALNILNYFATKNPIDPLEELYLEIIKKYPEKEGLKILKNAISETKQSYISYYIYAKYLINIERYEEAQKVIESYFEKYPIQEDMAKLMTYILLNENASKDSILKWLKLAIA